MSRKPLVSVLMGVHNEQAYVDEAVESILNQHYEHFEFIIVDDASTDDTTDIVHSYGDERLHVIENEENLGLTASLNRALGASNGDYIARQDADDRSHPGRLDRQVTFLETNEEVAVVGTGAYLIDDTGTVVGRRIGYCNPTFDDFLDKSHLVHGSIMARRSILTEANGYDEFFRYGQDYELWLRLLPKYPLANLPELLYDHRIHEGGVYFERMLESALYGVLARNLATGSENRSIIDELDDIRDYYDYLNPVTKQQLHEDLAVRCLRYGNQDLARRECKRARDIGKRSLRNTALDVLAMLGATATRTVIRGMRATLNMRIRLANRRCPYELG